MALQDQRSAGIALGAIGADRGGRLGKVVLDRAEAAQTLQSVDVDMPVVDLIAALPQQIAAHVLARPLGAAGRGNRDKIPCRRKLCVEIGVDGVEDLLLGIAGVHYVMVPHYPTRRSNHTLRGICMRFRALSESQPRPYIRLNSRPTETPDARQPQRSVPHHRRADRCGGCARLQPLPEQEGTGGPADQCRPERAEDSEQVKRAASPIMKISHIRRFSFSSLGGLALLALASPAMAQQVSREQDIVDLRLGQRILVDDGSCPTGQTKEESGARMSATGILRVQKCIPRLGPKKK